MGFDRSVSGRTGRMIREPEDTDVFSAVVLSKRLVYRLAIGSVAELCFVHRCKSNWIIAKRQRVSLD